MHGIFDLLRHVGTHGDEFSGPSWDPGKARIAEPGKPGHTAVSPERLQRWDCVRAAVFLGIFEVLRVSGHS